MRRIRSGFPEYLSVSIGFAFGGLISLFLEQFAKTLSSLFVILLITLCLAIGTWIWRRHRERKLGIYLPVFAINPTYYNQKRIDKEVQDFTNWVRKADANALVSPPVKVFMNDHESMVQLQTGVDSEILRDRAPIEEGYHVTMKVSGQLDACFNLGAHLRNTTGLPGPLWLVSDSIEYDEHFSPVAGIGRAADDPATHPLRLPPAKRRRPPSALVTNPPGDVVVRPIAFPEGTPANGLYCRAADNTWHTCTHTRHHASVVLALESLEEDPCLSRAAGALDQTPAFPPDVVLAVTATKGIGNEWNAYEILLDKLAEGAAAGRAAAIPEAELYVALACPPAVAAALGARLNSINVTWEPLQYIPGEGYVRSNL